MLEDFVRRDHVGVRPDVQMRHPDENRDEQQRKDGQHAGGGTDRAPQHDTPCAAGELVHHAERQAAERHAEAQHVADQVRLVELRRVAGESARRRADDDACRARRDERQLVPFEFGNQLARGLFEHHYCSLPRCSAGTSAIVACSLSCSARIYAAMAQRSRGSTCCR